MNNHENNQDNDQNNNNDDNNDDIHKIEEYRGRFGNRLSIYAYNYIYNKHHGLPNINKDATIVIYPIVPKDILQQEKSNVPELIKYQYTLIKKHGPGKHSFPHDVRFYQNYREELIENSVSKDLIKTDYDITIHVRTDDIGNEHTAYTALPSSYYKNCLKHIYENKTKNDGKALNVLIVSKTPHDNFTKKVLEVCVNTCKTFKELNRNSLNKIDIQHSSLERDFSSLLGSSILIMSMSTFSYWAAFFGPFMKEVHVPGWGLCVDYWDNEGGERGDRDDSVWGVKGAGNMNLDKWHSTPKTNIVVHKLKILKIREKNSELLNN